MRQTGVVHYIGRSVEQQEKVKVARFGRGSLGGRFGVIFYFLDLTEVIIDGVEGSCHSTVHIGLVVTHEVLLQRDKEG